jgi:predicted kinase
MVQRNLMPGFIHLLPASTYRHLAEMAKLLLNAHFPVIIDAACLKFEQRDLLRQVAVELEKPFVTLHFFS